MYNVTEKESPEYPIHQRGAPLCELPCRTDEFFQKDRRNNSYNKSLVSTKVLNTSRLRFTIFRSGNCSLIFQFSQKKSSYDLFNHIFIVIRIIYGVIIAPQSSAKTVFSVHCLLHHPVKSAHLLWGGQDCVFYGFGNE